MRLGGQLVLGQNVREDIWSWGTHGPPTVYRLCPRPVSQRIRGFTLLISYSELMQT